MEWSSICLVRTNGANLSKHAFEIADEFLDRFVRQCPELSRALTWDRDLRRRELVEMFSTVLKNSANETALRLRLESVAMRNERRGVRSHHGEAGRQILLDLLSEYNGPTWSPEMKRAWSELLSIVAECATPLSETRRMAA